jgi:hypothetical protein
MTPYELQMVTLDAHKRFYKARRMFAIDPGTPRYRKHQIEGYLISRAWEWVPENREFLRELRDFSESQFPPLSANNGFMGSGRGSGLETATP